MSERSDKFSRFIRTPRVLKLDPYSLRHWGIATLEDLGIIRTTEEPQPWALWIATQIIESYQGTTISYGTLLEQIAIGLRNRGILSERKEESMINEFRQLNLDRPDPEYLVGLYAFGESLKASYAKLELECPEWVDANMGALKREILNRAAALKEKRVKEIKLQLNSLRTAEEKRAALIEELKALEAK